MSNILQRNGKGGVRSCRGRQLEFGGACRALIHVCILMVAGHVMQMAEALSLERTSAARAGRLRRMALVKVRLAAYISPAWKGTRIIRLPTVQDVYIQLQQLCLRSLSTPPPLLVQLAILRPAVPTPCSSNPEASLTTRSTDRCSNLARRHIIEYHFGRASSRDRETQT
jgi:hypothetical protein